MATTVENAVRRIASLADEVGADAQKNADISIRRRIVSLSKTAADAMASTATSAYAEAGLSALLGATDADAFTVEDVYILPLGALTASDANFATITIAYDDAAGGADTTIVAPTTKTTGSGGTGSWTAGTAIKVSPTQAVKVPKGSGIIVSIAKSGTGVVVPISNYVLVGRLT